MLARQVALSHGQQSNLALLLKLVFVDIIGVSFVGIESSAFGQRKSHLLHAGQVGAASAQQKYFHRTPCSRDNHMGFETVEKLLLGGAVAIVSLAGVLIEPTFIGAFEMAGSKRAT